MSNGATVSFSSSSDACADFVASFADVIEQEARKVWRKCSRLSLEDLQSEGVLKLLESMSYFTSIKNPRAYIRISIRRYLFQYAFEHDSLIRTPRSRVEPIFCLSLDTSVDGQEDGETFADLLAAPPDDDRGYGSLVLACEHLTDLQRQVLMARFDVSGGRLRPFRKVAKDVGLSPGATFRLIQEALAVLRRELAVEDVEVAG